MTNIHNNLSLKAVYLRVSHLTDTSIKTFKVSKNARVVVQHVIYGYLGCILNVKFGPNALSEKI